MKTQSASTICLSDEFMNSIWIFFESNLAVRTRRTYLNVIKNFVHITGKEPLYLTQAAADQYCQYLEERLKSNRLSYNTAVMRISVMRTLCEFIRHKKEQSGQNYTNYFNTVILPDADKTLLNEELPTENDLNGLLETVREYNDDTAFLIFSLVLKCGLTSSEISRLDVEFLVLDIQNTFCIHFPAKKHLTRIIRLPQDICTLLNTYIDQHCLYSGAVFYNQRKTRMKVRDAERLLKKYVERGMQEKRITKPFTLQSMRHAAFKYMLVGGASEEEVAKYGGITTKWMSRYRTVTNSAMALDTADYSVIHIKSEAITQFSKKD